MKVFSSSIALVLVSAAATNAKHLKALRKTTKSNIRFVTADDLVTDLDDEPCEAEYNDIMDCLDGLSPDVGDTCYECLVDVPDECATEQDGSMCVPVLGGCMEYECKECATQVQASLSCEAAEESKEENPDPCYSTSKVCEAVEDPCEAEYSTVLDCINGMSIEDGDACGACLANWEEDWDGECTMKEDGSMCIPIVGGCLRGECKSCATEVQANLSCEAAEEATYEDPDPCVSTDTVCEAIEFAIA